MVAVVVVVEVVVVVGMEGDREGRQICVELLVGTVLASRSGNGCTTNTSCQLTETLIKPSCTARHTQAQITGHQACMPQADVPPVGL